MADSVTVDHGGVTITTNTASEADLRTEMEAPATSEAAAPPAESVAVPVRDGQGRFAKAEHATAPVETPAPAEPAADTEPAARRREDPRLHPQARMMQAVAQKAEAERRAAAAEAELARYRQAAPPPPAPPPPSSNGHASPAEPQFEQFAQEADPYTAYLQAWNRWNTTETVKQEVAQARAAWDADQAQQARAKTFEARLAEGRTRIPDFDNVLQEADTLGLQISAVMQEAIADSPHAADLVHYLATHPEACTQLAEASVATPVSAATVMPMRTSLELHLQGSLAPRAAPVPGSGSAARAVVSTAKPPIRPVGSSPVVSDEPPGESASAAEHARYHNRKLRVPGTKY